MKPATADVLALLRAHPEGITPLQAQRAVGTMRLAARVWELVHVHGFDVRTESATEGRARFALYTLFETPVQSRLWDNIPVGSSDETNRIANGTRVSATTRGAGVVSSHEVVAR